MTQFVCGDARRIGMQRRRSDIDGAISGTTVCAIVVQHNGLCGGSWFHAGARQIKGCGEIAAQQALDSGMAPIVTKRGGSSRHGKDIQQGIVGIGKAVADQTRLQGRV